jgi:ATP-dependent RNA helicase DHX37/DHR1
MGKSRPRFNEKARASSRKPNQRPHPKARDGGLGQQAFDPSAASTTASQKQSNEG